MGMSRGQMLRIVQLPLAAPVIAAGVRTATVWTVGAATLATPVGQPCLGNYIFAGLQTRNFAMLLVGVVAAAGARHRARRAARRRGARARRRGASAARGARPSGWRALVVVIALLPPRVGAVRRDRRADVARAPRGAPVTHDPDRRQDVHRAVHPRRGAARAARAGRHRRSTSRRASARPSCSTRSRTATSTRTSTTRARCGRTR